MLIQDILKRVVKSDLSRAKKFPVRELELDNTGRYIAFVDQGEHSFDVSIEFSDNNVGVMTCDCGSGADLCLHKIAVLSALKNNQKSKNTLGKKTKKTTKKKKLSETDELLLQINKDVLTQWLKTVFKKNKSLEKQFVLTFSNKEIEYTAEQVKELTEEIISSVAGKRKTLEAIKIKQILDLLLIAYEPINNFVIVNISKPISHKIFASLLDCIYAFDHRISHHSKKFSEFVDSFVEQFALNINNIQDEKEWRHVVEIQIQRLFTLSYRANKEYDYMLVQFIYLTAPPHKVTIYMELLKNILIENAQIKYLFRNDFIQFLLKVTAKHNIYQDVRTFFDK